MHRKSPERVGVFFWKLLMLWNVRIGRDAERVLDDLDQGEDGEHDEHADHSPHDVALADFAFVRLVGVHDELHDTEEEDHESHGESKHDERVDDVPVDLAHELRNRRDLGPRGIGSIDPEKSE